jgi:hypothetical protein
MRKLRAEIGQCLLPFSSELLSSRLLSENVKIKMYKNIVLPVDLYGRKTWSLTLREGHQLKVFENRVLRGIFGPKSENCIIRCSFTCTPQQI